MVITTTGIAFSISSIGLAFCGFWFFRAFQKVGGLRSGSKIGILLSVYFLGTAFQHGILAIGGWFFAKNSEALYATLVIDQFVLAIITALGVYLGFYILLPNFSPWPGTVLIFLYGIFAMVMTIIDHPQPFISSSGIDLGMRYRTELFLYLLLLFNIGPLFLIFIRNFFLPVTRDVKTISAIITAATSIGLINVSVRFSGLFGTQDFRVRIFDRILTIIGILFIVGFLFIPLYWRWSFKHFRGEIQKV